MAGSSQYAIYNPLSPIPRGADHPLRDLLPDDDEHGWHVARNLRKPLNHLDFLRQKENLAAELHLHSELTPRSWFDVNYELLSQHQAGKVSTSGVIRQLAAQLYAAGHALSEDEIIEKLRAYAAIRHMEFHPSDICSLTCRGCTYGHDDTERKPAPICFPFGRLCSIVQMRPRSMVIIGGGEPTLYKSGAYRFKEMVEEIRHLHPGIALALITNGVYKPPGSWPEQLQWIRVSLDAATDETYTAFRGKRMFQRVVQNYLSYLDHDVRYVGIGFLFSRLNIHEYAAVARFLFDLVRRERPESLHKVNIQYRPLRFDPNTPFALRSLAITEEQIQKVVREIRELADASPEIKQFLRNQTNITAVLGGNAHQAHEFSRCHYSQTFRIVRANGDLFPCFIRVTEPDFRLGNIITDPLETIALNTLFVGARRKPFCDSHGCRQCHVNYVFEQGLRQNIHPSTAPEVLADPMY